ncbi:hypothetical protein E6C27_scaffold468G00840 [Cucumis melo var. makuwa]|uniref:Uncharacterized protein n=1 Tax=Cucumis melo var. makuwa TaxID=1194695 RepID=A0A5A7V6Y4_CUCMM|nr:hypothetical protein E6C27_scaffold468G00840 [Cucumis melo var. makuwa]
MAETMRSSFDLNPERIYTVCSCREIRQPTSFNAETRFFTFRIIYLHFLPHPSDLASSPFAFLSELDMKFLGEIVAVCEFNHYETMSLVDYHLNSSHELNGSRSELLNRIQSLKQHCFKKLDINQFKTIHSCQDNGLASSLGSWKQILEECALFSFCHQVVALRIEGFDLASITQVPWDIQQRLATFTFLDLGVTLHQRLIKIFLTTSSITPYAGIISQQIYSET